MRPNVIGLTTILLILTCAGCQKGESLGTEVAATNSPGPTLPIGVYFETVTPSSGTSEPVEAQTLTATAVLPTETATPTAVTYIVKAGDTLVGIAAAQGVGLDELLSLNPGVQPELLMVGQEVNVPPRPTIEATAPPATDVADSIDIAGIGVYSSASGGTWILGEVRNNSQRAIELAQVRVIMRSPDGEVLASRDLWITPVTIAPNSRAPFGTLFSVAYQADATAEAKVVAGRPVNELGNRYLDLAVVNAKVTLGHNPIRVSGQIENQGDSPARQISIVTTFYNDRGTVTGFQELVMPDTISPGESRPFESITLPPGGLADSFGFAIQATVAE